LENAVEKVVPKKAKAAKKEAKIRICNDVLEEVIKWTPLKYLPKLNPPIWWFCDAELDARNYTIHNINLAEMTVNGEGLMMVTVTQEKTIKKRLLQNEVTVPLAIVEPPKNYKLRSISLPTPGKIGPEMFEFLRVSKRLFVNAKFTILWKPFDETLSVKEKDDLDELLNIFDTCSIIKIWKAESDLTWEFFAKESVVSCNSLQFSWVAGFDLNAIFDWLHTPPANDPNGKRQILFKLDIGDFDANSLEESIKKKFLENETEQRHKFVVRFGIHDDDLVETFRLENQRTDEVLFTQMVSDNGAYDLIRCASGDVGTIAYKKPSEKEKTKIPKIEMLLCFD